MKTDKINNSNADFCKKAVDYEFLNISGLSEEFYGWTAVTADFGDAIRQIPFSTIVFGVEIFIHK